MKMGGGVTPLGPFRERVVGSARSPLRLRPRSPSRGPKVAACYAQLERRDEALNAVASFEQGVERERREGNPRVSIEMAIRDTQTFYKSQDDRDHWLEGFRKAGFEV